MKVLGPCWHQVTDFFFYYVTGISCVKPGREGEKQSQRNDFRACIFTIRCSRSRQLDSGTEPEPPFFFTFP